MYSISFIGAGNVAHRFSLSMQDHGFAIDCIYNRTPEHREALVGALNSHRPGTRGTERLGDLFSSDLVFIAVSDNAIPETVATISRSIGGTHSAAEDYPVFIHTSGATGAEVFRPLEEKGIRCGVFYPVMTLSRNKNVEFSDIPILYESNDPEVEKKLCEIAAQLGAEHFRYDSEQRLKMHAAAVFTCNFVNCMLDSAFTIIGRDTPLLLPSTLESVRNCFLHTPEAAITGPARRGDTETIRKHLDLLERMQLNDQKEIYTLLSRKIFEKYNKK